MKHNRIALVFVLAFLLGCGKVAVSDTEITTPFPTATPVPSAAPTTVPTILPEPTICPEPTETAAPVVLGECPEEELWYIENVLQQKYETIVTITMDYADELITFYIGYIGEDWYLIKYCFG